MTQFGFSCLLEDLRERFKDGRRSFARLLAAASPRGAGTPVEASGCSLCAQALWHSSNAYFWELRPLKVSSLLLAPRLDREWQASFPLAICFISKKDFFPTYSPEQINRWWVIGLNKSWQTIFKGFNLMGLCHEKSGSHVWPIFSNLWEKWTQPTYGNVTPSIRKLY